MPANDSALHQATPPIMRQTALELRRLLHLRSTRHQQLQEVLLSDPGATVAVFRQLGRVLPDAPDKVGNAAHAVSLIGVDDFRRLLDRLPEVAPASQRCDAGGGPAGAYSQAAHAALYAGALSAHKGISGGCEVPTAALLQNPAILALWSADPKAAARASSAVREGVRTALAFTTELGEPLDAANRRLAECWALPRLARLAMEAVTAANSRSQAVRLADGLAHTTAAGWRHAATEEATAQLSEFLDLSQDAATAWLHQQAGDAARRLGRLDYPLPGFELMFMAGEAGGDEGPGTSRSETTSPVESPLPARPSSAPDLHATMAEIMRRIREETGARRVTFVMLDRARTRLRTRLALGGDPGDALRHLELDLAEKNLFSALMGRAQSAWLHPGNAVRYADYLPPSLQQLLDPAGAFLMSLFVGDRPLGLLYCDGEGLARDGYQRFRELCSEATATLGGGSRAVPIPQSAPS